MLKKLRLASTLGFTTEDLIITAHTIIITPIVPTIIAITIDHIIDPIIDHTTDGNVYEESAI